MEDFIKSIRPYTKTVVAFVVGVLQLLALYVTLSANGISVEDAQALIYAAILALGGTVGVYQLPNKKITQE